MDVFRKICVEDMLKQPGKTMIVLWDHQDEGIGFFHEGGEAAVFNRFAGIINWDRQFSDINEF